MGRAFDGGYQQNALLPETHVIPVQTTLDWATLGAIPETFGTAWGSLEVLRLTSGDSVLIHGGSSSVAVYSSSDINRASYGQALQDIIRAVEAGRYRVNLDRRSSSEIGDAHRYMEANRAVGKLVVLTPDD